MQRLLIVEDDADIAAAFQVLFSRPGIVVEVAINGIQAVARARETRPDVILMDVGLPAMDGLEVFMTLRRDPDLLATRVIFVSAEAPGGALTMAREFGAYACLKKPVSGSLLVERVHQALGIKIPAGYRVPSGRIGKCAPPRIRSERAPEHLVHSTSETTEFRPLEPGAGEQTIRDVEEG